MVNHDLRLSGEEGRDGFLDPLAATISVAAWCQPLSAQAMRGKLGGMAASLMTRFETLLASCLILSNSRFKWELCDAVLRKQYIKRRIRFVDKIIEVKSAENVRARSLGMFREKYHPETSVRMSMKNFGRENGILSIPLYAVFAFPSTIAAV